MEFIEYDPNHWVRVYNSVAQVGLLVGTVLLSLVVAVFVGLSFDFLHLDMR